MAFGIIFKRIIINFFLKIYFWKKEKIWMILGKKVERKLVLRMRYSQERQIFI